MEETWFPQNSSRPKRATLRLIEPALQLRLPLYLVGITTLFAVCATAHSWYAYDTLLSNVLPIASEGYRGLLDRQTGDFLVVSSVLLLAYGLVILGVCVAYLRRLAGPMVAFRRQIALMRRGDYSARNSLRKGAPFEDLAKDLNSLAKALEVRRERKLLDH